ncbi:MAG: D-cysteine desulfhydrase family protein [Proteobacteria bacterium]|nr:D-cysteine desulfhydrase family protein [Pseudomonadota bacterium]
MNASIWQWLTDIERVPLGFTPTPLQPLDRLSEELGGPRIWLKRDDNTGLATGGNKTRKLEYLLADARTAGADTVITFGAVQSNHARQTAAACAVAGLRCHLVLSRRVSWKHPQFESAGNVLLDHLLGAHVHIIEPDQVSDFTRDLRTRLKAQGQKPYLIPAGGSNSIGALGYVRCAMELTQQFAETGCAPERIYHASSSAGTQSGLVVGMALLSDAIRVCGINVYHDAAQPLIDQIKTITSALIEERGLSLDVSKLIDVDHRYFGEDYGLPTKATLQAIKLAASTEGILFDPVYSGKALAGLIDQIVIGEISHKGDVVFVHTGGSASLGVYDTAFKEFR